MFENLLLHPRTRVQIDNFIAAPSHGLILSGVEGSGKRTLAITTAAALLGVETDALLHHPYYSYIDPLDKYITIDQIRELQKLLKLKTPVINKQKIQRVIVVVDAGRMRGEAQNSFLKSLEEPPEDTCILLTSEADGSLLSTIVSRLQSIDVMPVSMKMASSYYGKLGISEAEIVKNYALSQGQTGLLHSLLNNNVSHPLKNWVEIAKILLKKSPGERILQTDEFSKDKEGVQLLLNALSRIVHSALFAAGNQENITSIDRWRKSLKTIQETKNALAHNANIKLLLDNLLLNI